MSRLYARCAPCGVHFRTEDSARVKGPCYTCKPARGSAGPLCVECGESEAMPGGDHCSGRCRQRAYKRRCKEQREGFSVADWQDIKAYEAMHT